MQHELIAFVVLRELTRLPEQSSSSTKAGCPGSPRGERSDEPNERAAAIRAVLSASLLTAERGRRIGAQHAAAGHDGRHNPDESHKQWGDEQCDGVAWSDSVQL